MKADTLLISQQEDNRLTKILGIFAALSVPMEEYYVFGMNLNLIWVVLLIGVFFSIKSKPRTYQLSKTFLILGYLYLLLNIISQVLYNNTSWYSSASLNNTFFLIPMTFLMLYWYTDRLSIKYFIITATILAIFASILIVYQRISFIFWGSYNANWSLDFIPGIEWGRKESLEVQMRPSAFFSEPAHYAEYCLPVLVYNLQKQNTWISLIITIGIIISGSTNGLAGMAVVWLSVLILDWGKDKTTTRKSIIYISVILILLTISYTLINLYIPEIIEFQRNKIENTDAGSSARLLGPLPVILSFNIIQALLGIGIGNKINYIVCNHIPMKVDTDGDYMSNAIFSLIIYFGIIGFVAFTLYMVKLYKTRCKGYSYSYIILMITLFFSTAFIFDSNLLYYTFFVANTPYLVTGNNYLNFIKN